jgi:hypothetical protein
MSPAFFEADLLERRRQAAWRRLARPGESDVSAQADDPAEPYSLGYPRHSPLLRALVPIALAFLLFLTYGASRSTPAAPRTAHPEQNR